MSPQVFQEANMLQLDKVSVTYGKDFTALHPTSLKLEKGKFTVLLGPSGAGKSTLLRSLNLLVPPTSGEIKHQELGLIQARSASLRQHRRQTAMIFQQHQLIGRHSAMLNVLSGRLGYYHPLRSLFPLPDSDKTIALECLERVGLLHKALERVDNLSGGQQQRVGIARGLAQQPQLILADEPVASLDPATSRKVLSQLHTICREDGLTAVVSLHQVEFAMEFADRIIGLAAGHVIFDGSPSELTESALDDIYHGEPQSAESKDPVTVTPEPELAYQT
ncbi:MAG: phosphonate ABC transporter ATP-binding protein [Thiohalophilus sp.]